MILFISFFFFNPTCGVEVIFISGFLVLFLLRVKIMGDGIFSQGPFRNMTWSKYWVNDNVDTMVKNKIPAQEISIGITFFYGSDVKTQSVISHLTLWRANNWSNFTGVTLASLKPHLPTYKKKQKTASVKKSASLTCSAHSWWSYSVWAVIVCQAEVRDWTDFMPRSVSVVRAYIEGWIIHEQTMLEKNKTKNKKTKKQNKVWSVFGMILQLCSLPVLTVFILFYIWHIFQRRLCIRRGWSGLPVQYAL